MGHYGTRQLSTTWQPFRRTGEATFEVALGADDREVLRALPGQLRAAMVADPGADAFRRLHPPAYANDDVAEKEFQELIGAELDDSRAQALEILAKTADAAELSADELNSWVRALNDIRLWLGTMLDVNEDADEDDLADPAHLLYHALTYLQGSVIEALSGE